MTTQTKRQWTRRGEKGFSQSIWCIVIEADGCASKNICIQRLLSCLLQACLHKHARTPNKYGESKRSRLPRIDYETTEKLNDMYFLVMDYMNICSCVNDAM